MARKKFTRNDFRRALRKVRTKLLNGKISDAQFNMDIILSVDPEGKGPLCGTVACLGGHMAIELDPRVVSRRRRYLRTGKYPSRGPNAARIMDEAVQHMPNLKELFFEYPRGLLTRKRCAGAVTRALDGKEDPWKGRA